ncbi:hypothetical protein BJF79_19620 [Actinomadura sp. CNU-125]|nr:hypothetical protein BJF79_19620 [Actinomadura sp. CNU-125]
MMQDLHHRPDLLLHFGLGCPVDLRGGVQASRVTVLRRSRGAEPGGGLLQDALPFAGMLMMSGMRHTAVPDVVQGTEEEVSQTDHSQRSPQGGQEGSPSG